MKEIKITITKLEDRSYPIWKKKKKRERENRLKKLTESEELWDYNKRCNIYVIRDSEEKEKKGRAKKNSNK